MRTAVSADTYAGATSPASIAAPATATSSASAAAPVSAPAGTSMPVPDVATATATSPASATAPTLILFTRVPQAGRAKTRLIPALGAQGAAEFQWGLLERLLAELQAGAAQGLWRLSVHYCGQEGLPRLQAMLDEATALTPQADDPDLGVRMREAIGRELAAGAPAVGLMGSDLPGAARDVVAAALTLLARPETDVALCPTLDGGYWFVGLKRPFPQLFEGTTYGGATVFDDALAACRAHGRAVAVGPSLRDIDTPEDLACYLREGATPGRS